MFFALCTAENLLCFTGDAQDAFAHAPTLTPYYLRVDDAFIEWYKLRYGVTLSRHMVIPILMALQGHPEAAALWEKHITTILHPLLREDWCPVRPRDDPSGTMP